ncbi:hypothetical protein CORC01_00261 [Colletotrichum orchidophilum]|uniref:BTB domain-containing protein n=1 Tax=Colletotrichum orchidophilum TaxID=1209926 RepID=A0A1G4BSM2_9PEZI|nr:uncharacterized protein CORC01_00261 [Colletotrichum orchidophilum]OHF04409.1 hypothetical protein CORC01_00261 [Colletotrichum orchidophilum]
MAGIDLTRLYNSNSYSDLLIEASGRIFLCHKCIIFTQCEEWKNLPLVDGRLVLNGANTIEAILKYMYSGTYEPFNIACGAIKPQSLDTNKEGPTHELDYSDHSMLLSACILARAKAYNMSKLHKQAKTALLSIAPNLTNHADFIFTVSYVLQTHQDEEGMQIAVNMIKPQYKKDLGLRRRLSHILSSYPRLACVLLEQVIDESRVIKSEQNIRYMATAESGETSGEPSGASSLQPAASTAGSPQWTPLRLMRATSTKRKADDDDLVTMKHLKQSVEQ